PTTFHFDASHKLIMFTKKDGPGPKTYKKYYKYSKNLINETDSAGNVLRKFYFERNNLIKVVTERYDSEGLIHYKKEILFQEFDNRLNPFKNMYYVKGAFFRAFSDNNYKSVTINKYRRSPEGELELMSYEWFSMPFSYNKNGYPMFGDYQ
ncbi:MAG: hypothetical protein PHT07_23020, partial [Paludibacter sp.]|nr:hypothetical protein [Paludibacter sp.]